MLAIKLIMEGFGLGFLLYLVCAIGIRNGADGMIHLYEQTVQNRAVELGMTTEEEINKRSLLFKAVCIPGYMIYVLVCVYALNGARGVWPGFWQAFVILSVMNLIDRFLIDEYWVGHTAVIQAINQVIAQKDDLLPGLKTAIKKALDSGNGTRVAEIDAQLEDLEKELLKRANTKQDYTDILEQLDAMRDAKQELLLEDANNAGIQRQLNAIEAFLESQQTAIEEYDEALVRKLLERVMVYDDHLTFEFKSGIEIGITM